MARRLGRTGILVALTAALLLAVVALGLSYSDVGAADKIEARVASLTVLEPAGAPRSVVDDANRLASDLFGDDRANRANFVNQLLATYLEAMDKDVLVLFNSGGWGVSPVDRTPGWRSILDGMKAELDSRGYTALVVNYRRTSETVRGCVKELLEMVSDYPSKAGELARRVMFLTDHIPSLKVIIAGESNGSIISDSVMSILRDNPRVYSIQTGPPVWEKPAVAGRTLVMRNNGMVPDSFSYADIPTLLWSNLKALLRLSSPEEAAGRVLYYLRAPGHDYSWQYPAVSNQIMKFLDENFGMKQG